MKTRIAPLLAAAACLVPLAQAHADWQGDLHLKSPLYATKDGADMAGKVMGRATSLRMDLVTSHGPMSIISDWKTRKVWNLMHTQKMVMASNLDQVGVDIPRCAGTDFDVCLVKDGFKKTGNDNLYGHPCEVYEKLQNIHARKTLVKIWRPTDLKEVPLLRSTSQEGDKPVGRVDFTNVKVVGKLPDTLFAPPADYHSLQLPGADGHQ